MFAKLANGKQLDEIIWTYGSKKHGQSVKIGTFLRVLHDLSFYLETEKTSSL